jgi:hypothetical protein
MSDMEYLLKDIGASSGEDDVSIADVLDRFERASVATHFEEWATLRPFLKRALALTDALSIHDDVYDGAAIYRNRETEDLVPVYVLAVDAVDTVDCLKRLALATNDTRYIIVVYDGDIRFTKIRKDNIRYHELDPKRFKKQLLSLRTTVQWTCDDVALEGMIADLREEFRMPDCLMSITELERRLHSDVVILKLKNTVLHTTIFSYSDSSRSKQAIYAAIFVMSNCGDRCVDGILFITLVHLAMHLLGITPFSKKPE